MIVEFAPYLVSELIGETKEEYRAQELFLQMIQWRLTYNQASKIAKYWEVNDFNMRELLDIS